MPNRIRLLIIDDSAFIRSALRAIFDTASDIEVIGEAVDPFDAREKIKTLHPDVVTLDIEMPKMDGLSFLEKIMTLRPMPVVMVSTLTQKGAEASIRALEIGAFDVIGKPSGHDSLQSVADDLIAKVRGAARANIRPRTVSHHQDLKPPVALAKALPNALIAIGSSTGGVEALGEIIPYLPANSPPVLIVQHMPAQFTTSFATRLDKISHVTVHEAHNGQAVQAGHVYIAPGGFQMKLAGKPGAWHCRIEEGVLVSGHKPSADVLFDSVADHMGKNAVGAILTGMGRDGAIGLLKMRDKGAKTLGQNEPTCVVYGMPKAAKLNGAVAEEVPLHSMAKALMQCCAS